jgi:hypothetical protein
LNHGFAFLYPRLEPLQVALRAVYGLKDEVSAPNGMVSLTGIPFENAGTLSQEFGSFGISVVGLWATFHGARPVTYVEHSGTALNSKIEQLKALALKELFGKPVQELLEDPKHAFMTKGLLSSPYAPDNMFEQLKDYYKCLTDLFFWESVDFSHEQEWRILNPRAYTFLGRYSLKEQKQILIAGLLDKKIPDDIEGLVTLFTKYGNIACVGKVSLALRVPAVAINRLAVPSYAKELNEALDLANYPQAKRYTVGRNVRQ